MGRRRGWRLCRDPEAAGHVAGRVHRASSGSSWRPGISTRCSPVVAVLCIAVGAGAAGAINMWYERDIDAVMRRTAAAAVAGGPDDARRGARFRRRAGGRLGPGHGAGDQLGGGGLAGADHRLLRFRLYHLAQAAHPAEHRDRRRRRRVPAADRLGGGRPASIGWGAIALFAIIFFWTPPHFWALSLYRADDYAKAGVPMLPVVAGPRETKRQMLLYTLVLWPVSAGALAARHRRCRLRDLGAGVERALYRFVDPRAGAMRASAAPGRCSPFRCSICC